MYAHKRLSSGAPFYVEKGHGRRAYSRDKRNDYWQKVVAKDGGLTVEFIVTNVDEELAFLAEMETIDQFRRLGFSLTNMSDGGEGLSGYVTSEETRRKISALKIGKPRPEHVRAKMAEFNRNRPPPSAETKRKISEALIGNTYRRGKRSSVETRAKQSIAQTGRKHSEETKAKISAGNMGKVISEEARKKHSEAMKGRPLSEETKRKMSETRKGRPGRPHTEDAKAKISAAHTGKKASAETRAVLRTVHLARWARIKGATNG